MKLPALDLSGLELRRFTRAKLTRIALAGMVMVPLLYAGLYLWSFWDPNGKFKHLPVALVVLDQPLEAGGKKVAAGHALAKELTDRHNFDWQVTDPYTAKQGVADGTYYFSLTIPPDFSARIASPSGDDPVTPADLQVQTNDSNNYIVGTIAAAAFAEIRATASANATTSYFDNVFVSFGTLHDSLAKATDGADRLTDGAHKAGKGAKTLADGLGTARKGGDKLATGTKTLAGGLGTARTGSGKLASGANTLADGLDKARAGGGKLATGANTLADGIDKARAGGGKLATGANTLAEGIDKAKQGSGKLATGAHTLHEGLGTADDGGRQLAAGLTKLDEGSAALAEGSRQVATGLNALTTKVNSYGDRLVPFLSAHVREIRIAAKAVAVTADAVAAAADDLPALTAKAEDDARKARTDLDEFVKAHPELPEKITKRWQEIADEIVDVADRVHTYVLDHRTALKRIKDEATVIAAKARELDREAPGLAAQLQAALDDVGKLNAGGQAVAKGAGTLNDGLDQATLAAWKLSSGLDRLNTGAGTLAVGADGLYGGLGRLSGGAQTLSTGAGTLSNGLGRLSGGAHTLGTGAGSLSNGLGTLSDGARRLSTGQTTLTGGLGRLSGGAGQLLSGQRSLNGGLGKLRTGAGSLETGIGSLAKGSSSLADGLADGVQQVPLYSDQERADRAAMMAAPVRLTTERTDAVPNYGTGFAPFFVPLSLWVGAMITYMILKPLNARALAGNAPPWRIAVAGWLPAVLIGAGQVAVVLLALRLGLGFHAVHWFGLAFLLCLGAAAFAAVIQWANAQFGTVGKVVALVLLMLQLTSAAGTYPIETSPRFFQLVQNWLPMPWLVRAMRRLVSGGELSVVLLTSLVMVVFIGIFLGLTMLSTRSNRTWSVARLHPALKI